MSEMIERVARAMARKTSGFDVLDSLPAGHSTYGEDGLWKADYLDMARAAIEAMREPTDDVAGVMSAHARNGMVDWRDLHRAMIDAALDKVTA